MRTTLPNSSEGFSVDTLEEEIRDLYQADNRPWVIGYSGGKDSTCALQIIWHAVARLEQPKRRKPIYILSSDTLVETPVIVDYINNSLAQMNAAAQSQGIPFLAQKVTPEITQSFWVNLIGRGYPAPSRRFRWCTERLKIDPANAFIKARIAEFGEVIMVLGVRASESATRAQVMALHKIRGSRLSRHSSLANAFVFTPIEKFSVDDVWTYLLQTPSPWGADNKELLTLYRNAQAGECPLVVDKTTPSCGNSRFGCWVCTVVTKDKAMEALIDSGEDWLEPLLELRDELASTQVPQRKREVRDFRRRSGQITFQGDSDDPIPGPYTLEYCKQVLVKLLQAQVRIRQGSRPGEVPILIQDAELHEIRRIWRTERSDWEDAVPKIVEETLGRNWHFADDDSARFSGGDAGILKQVCADHRLPIEMMMQLLEVERSVSGLKRRASVHTRITSVLEQEWRDLDAVIAERKSRKDVSAAQEPELDLGDNQ